MRNLSAVLQKYANAAPGFGVKTEPLVPTNSVFPAGDNFGVKTEPLVPQGGLLPNAQPQPAAPAPSPAAGPKPLVPQAPAAPQPAPPAVKPPAPQPAPAAATPAPAPAATGTSAQPAQPVTVPTTENASTEITPQAPPTTAPTAESILAQLPKDSKIPPAQQAEFAKGIQDWVGQNTDRIRGAQEFMAGKKDTPQAQAFAQQFQKSQNDFVSAQMQKLTAADPVAAATPQGWAGMLNQATASWNQMPFEMQMLTGLGLGGGLMGMASSIFGEGGMGMGLLGLLGIGGGLAAGAAGGMFGQGASNMAADALYNVGSFFGAVPEAQAGMFDQLRGKDPLAALSGGPIGSRKDVAAKLEASKAKIDKLRQFMSLPLGQEAKLHLIQRLDPSIDSTETAQEILRNAGTVLSAYDDPNSALRQQMQQGQNYAQSTGVTGAAKEMGAKAIDYANRTPMGAKAVQAARNAAAAAAQGASQLKTKAWDYFTGKKGSADMNIQNVIEKWAFNDVDAKELNDLKAEKAKGVPYRVEDARREHELNMRQQDAAAKNTPPAMSTKKCVAVVMKAARCWSGYEPVPGAKAYSRGSCRPVNSKKTQKEMISGKKKEK